MVAVGYHPTDGSAIVTVRGDIDTESAAQLWQYQLGEGEPGADSVTEGLPATRLVLQVREKLAPAVSQHAPVLPMPGRLP